MNLFKKIGGLAKKIARKIHTAISDSVTASAKSTKTIKTLATISMAAGIVISPIFPIVGICVVAYGIMLYNITDNIEAERLAFVNELMSIKAQPSSIEPPNIPYPYIADIPSDIHTEEKANINAVPDLYALSDDDTDDELVSNVPQTTFFSAEKTDKLKQVDTNEILGDAYDNDQTKA